MKLNFAKPEMPKTGAVVVGILDGRKLSPGATMIDRAAGGAITRAIEASRFKGGAEDALTVLAPNGLQASRVLLLGLGKPEKFDRQAAERVGGRIVVQLQNSGESEASVLVDGIAGAEITAAEMAALIAPKPFMVERGHSDGVGIDEQVAYEYAKVRRLYDRLKIGEHKIMLRSRRKPLVF